MMVGIGASGYIEKGKKFGLKIGDSKERVHARLTRLGLINGTKLTKEFMNLGYKMADSELECPGYIYDEKLDVEEWFEDSGFICLSYLDGKLTSIRWSYGITPP